MTEEYSASPEPMQAPAPADPAVVEAFLVVPGKPPQPLADPVGVRPPKGGFVWLHLNLDDAGDLVSDRLDLPELVCRALLAAETRPRCRFIENGVLINLRGVNLNENSRPEDMLSMRCWLESNRLITLRKRKSQAVKQLRERYRHGFSHDRASALLIDIIRLLIDFIDPVIDSMADSLDDLEVQALGNPGDTALRDRVSSIRHDAAIYRRYLAPMRDAIARFGSRDEPNLTRTDQTELDEQADRATRIVEELDMTIDRAQVIVDQMAAARSEKMNANMMVLSVLSSIFLPLGFLTGLLGVNIGGMPGTDTPSAFWIVVGICVVIGGGGFLFFRFRRWL